MAIRGVVAARWFFNFMGDTNTHTISPSDLAVFEPQADGSLHVKLQRMGALRIVLPNGMRIDVGIPKLDGAFRARVETTLGEKKATYKILEDGRIGGLDGVPVPVVAVKAAKPKVVKPTKPVAKKLKV